MTRHQFIVVPFVCFCLALAPAAAAETITPAPLSIGGAGKEDVALAALSPLDKGDIARIESYFDAVTTMTARFYQVTSQGGVAEGRIYLSRPGKMRVEYNPPTPLQIIADGENLIYYDSELNSANAIGLSETPAGVMLRRKLNLGSDVKISGFSRGRGVLKLTLVDGANPDAGTLALTFSDKPLILRKWAVTDPQGIVTTVALLDARFGMELDPELFVFEDPKKLYVPFEN
ncbi:MAG: outer membrane lipoprotein carrier protein LolA [Alphaproteobacteria bacterium]|nr:outer membrane lipoprotein carrier protein LolA [Alphaproteobacteria bacterium]